MNYGAQITYKGVGFFGLLGLLFIGLKLTGFIDWEWWIVLAPIWGSILATILILIIGFIIFLVRNWDEYR